MDYQRHYELLIDKARNVQITRSDGCYYEKHHIIPKSMGGSNNTDNVVVLTAKEHYVAHHLLWRIHRDTEHRFKMAKAFMIMTTGSKNQPRYYSASGYEEARKAHSAIMKVWIIDNHPRGFTNKHHTIETKSQISNRVKQTFKERGLLRPVYRFSLDGKLLEIHDSISDAAHLVNGIPSNIKYTCEGKFKTAYGFRWSYTNKCSMISLVRKQNYHSSDYKRRVSERMKGTVVVIDTSGNKFRTDLGDVRFKTGKIRKYVPTNRTKKLTATHKCVHCGKKTNIGNHTRWHDDNCKLNKGQ